MADEGKHLFDESRDARKRLMLAALGGAGLAVLLWLTGIGQSVDFKLYDTWFGVRGAATTTPQVTVVAIDAKSIGILGPYPWPRYIYAPLIRRLREAGAKVIGFDVTFGPNPQQDTPMEPALLAKINETPPVGPEGRPLAVIPNDELARAMKDAGNVVFSVEFDHVGDPSPPGAEPDEAMRKNALKPFDELGFVIPPAPELVPPDPKLGAAAAAIGFVNTGTDESDGAIRQGLLLIKHGKDTYMSLGMQVARVYQGTRIEDIKLEPGVIHMGYADIPISRSGQAFLNWPSTAAAFPYPLYSFVDVSRGDAPMDKFRDKVVLVAATAPGLDEKNTPFMKPGPGVIVHATIIDSIFLTKFLSYPTWSWILEILLVLGLAAAGVFFYPRLKTGYLFAIGPALAVALVGLSVYLFQIHGVWFKAFYPVLAVLLPLAGTIALKLRETETVARDVAAEKFENQKLLGLSFQEKGMLDMALGTFNKLPMNADMKQVYHNLGLDFENRGQREKAYLCYKRVFDADPGFEDVAVRMDNLQKAGVGTSFFAGPTQGMAGTLGMPPTITAAPGLGSGAPLMTAGTAGAATQASSAPEDADATQGLSATAAARAAAAIGTPLPGTIAGGTQGMSKTRGPEADGTLATPASPQRQGMFGRYEVLEKLGRGAMGDVFKVRDPKIGRVAAMKTIRADIDLSAQQTIEMRQRFYREAQTAGKLTHPNIVTIYDVGEEQGVSYIVMEFVEGMTLTGMLKKGKQLSVAQIKHIFTQAAAGLDYAHQNGVFHRDVKPDNIMIAPKTGVVKVMDFGIARIADSDMTKTGSVLGTPAYMSPEQFSGKKVDGRSDLFSLGVVLYEMLTRKRPFTGDTATAIMFAILQSEPLPPSQIDPQVSAEWDPVVQKALIKNVDERYQKMTDFINAVRAIQAK